MTHPHVLHALAALAALADALEGLPEAIRGEAVTRVPLGPSSGTTGRRSPASLAHLGRALVDERAERERTGAVPSGVTPAPVRAELLDLAHRAPTLVNELATDAAWIVASALRHRPVLVYGQAWRAAAGILGVPPAVAYLRIALPAAPPAVAREVVALLDAEADAAWSTLQLDRPRALLLGNPPCPSCSTRLLRVQTSGPRQAWTVVCAAECRCVGEGCPCGMATLTAGTVHIWRVAEVWTASDRGQAA